MFNVYILWTGTPSPLKKKNQQLVRVPPRYFVSCILITPTILDREWSTLNHLYSASPRNKVVNCRRHRELILVVSIRTRVGEPSGFPLQNRPNFLIPVKLRWTEQTKNTQVQVEILFQHKRFK